MERDYDLWELPNCEEMIMIVGWRQWADAGSVSSGLSQYLVQLNGARQIGKIKSDGFFLFQIPGTHDLVRPQIRFREGYPSYLENRRNEIYYFDQGRHGITVIIGDEPHIDIDRYCQALFDVASDLGVRRIIGLGGIYGEFPYDKERLINVNFSLMRLKEELSHYSVSFSDYEGGASIGSYLCRKAADRGVEYITFHAFVPAYNLTVGEEGGQSIRLENDYQAWLGILRRIIAMFKLELDLADLEQRCERLVELVQKNVDDIDAAAPELRIRDYLSQISDNFVEMEFNPLDEVWENELKRLIKKFDNTDIDEQ